MRSNWFAPAVIVVMIALGAAAYPFLPEQVPSHWGISGQVDGYTSRLWGVLLLPIAALVTWLGFRSLPGLDPRGANYAKFEGTYRLFMNVVVLFFAAVYAGTLAVGLGWNIAVPRLIVAAIGLLFAIMGNEMGRVQPNFFVGVRTPWTLADPEVWRQTHRASGRVMVVAGLLDMLGALILPEPWLLVVVLGGAIGFAMFSFVYSYTVWRRTRPAGKQ